MTVFPDPVMPMPTPPLDQRFRVLCEITRAQHFAWREAVRQLAGEWDLAALVERMWQITGEETAAAYHAHLDPAAPLAPQVARSIVWSSQCMGEDAAFEPGADDREAFVRHDDCPWFHHHRRRDLLAEDRPGCDAWFAATVAALNQALGARLCVETLAALPDGDPCCRRRVWVES